MIVCRGRRVWVLVVSITVLTSGTLSGVNKDTVRQAAGPTKELCDECRNRGYCDKSQGGVVCQCFERFYQGNNCSQEVDHCGANPCLNGGTCHSMWGNYFCECSTGFHGLHCNVSGKVARIDTPVVLINIQIETGADTLHVFICGEMNCKSDDFELKITSGDGIEFRVLSQHLIHSNNLYQLLSQNKMISDTLLHHVTRDPRKFYMLMMPYGTITTEPSYPKVAVYNKDEVQFLGTYMVLPRVSERNCTPTIRSKDCATESSKVNKFDRTELITARVEATPECDDQNSVLQFSYSLSHLTEEEPSPSKKNTRTLNVSANSTELSFEPYSLDVGTYILHIKVSEIIQKYGKKSWGMNQIACLLLQVYSLPLVVSLKNGDSFSVGVETTLTLDASETYDPNYAGSNIKHLNFSWSCWTKSQDDKFCRTQPIHNDPVLVVKENTLVVGEYVFTVTATSTRDLEVNGTAQTKVTVVYGRPPMLVIECVNNCDAMLGTSSQEVTYLKVMCLSACPPDIEYTWSVKANPNNTKQSLDWDTETQLGRNSDKLIINRDVLKKGETYTFTVTGGTASLESTSEKEVQVKSGPKLGTCKVEPPSGYSARTKFNITCTGSSQEDQEDRDLHLNYEFYQSHTSEEDQDSLGVLLYYKTLPQALNIFLKAGMKELDYKTNINVRISDQNGKFGVLTLQLKVLPMVEALPPTEDLLETVSSIVEGEGEHTSLEDRLIRGDVTGAVGLVVSLTDAISEVKHEEDSTVKKRKSALLTKFTTILNKVTVNNVEAVTQVTSALKDVVTTDPELLEISAVRTAAQLAQTTTDKLYLRVLEDEDVVIPTKIVGEVASNVAKIASVLLGKEFISDDDTKTTEVPDAQYPFYQDLDPEFILWAGDMDHVSANTLTSIKNIEKIVALRLSESEEPSVFKTDTISLWTQKESPTKLANKPLGAMSEKGSHVVIPPELAEHLQNQADQNFYVQVMMAKRNPFNWRDSGQQPNTDIVSVEMQLMSSKARSGHALAYPLDIFMNLESHDEDRVRVEGMVSMPSGETDQDVLEDCISVHRVTASTGDQIYVEFTSRHENNKLQVVVLLDERPEVEDFEKVPVTIAQDSVSKGQEYVIKGKTKANHDNSWFYLGFLPHLETIKGQSDERPEGNITIAYSFFVSTAKCRYWVEDMKEWSTEGCTVGDQTSLTTLHCSCTHMSVFAGSLLAADTKLDPFHRLPFSLVYMQSVYVPVFVSVVLVLLLLLFLWARWMDRKDSAKRVVVLEDNMPKYSYKYLVTARTGWKMNAGTSSKVGFQLVGDHSESQPHILSAQGRKVLTMGSEDSFLLLTPDWLGPLRSVRLWHDSSGRHPSWYCDEIEVRDVQRNQLWVFPVHRWLSLVQEEKRIEYQLQPASLDHLLHWRTSMYRSLGPVLREEHIWINIVTRHPRSSYTRCQRVAVASATLLAAMLISLLLFGVYFNDPTQQMYHGHFFMSSAELMVAVNATLTVLPLTFLLYFLFRWTAPQSDARPLPERAQLMGHGNMRRSEMRDENVPEGLEADEATKEDDHYNSRPMNERHYQLSRYLFPHWVVYVAWFVCVCVIVTSALLTAICGLSFGRVKSLVWIGCVALIFVVSFLLVQPVKVILIALLFSLVWKRPYNQSLMDEARSECQRQENLHFLSFGDRRKYRRTQRMYQPVPLGDYKRLREKEQIRAKLVDMSRDLFLYSVYLITLLWVAMADVDDIAFYSTQSILRMVIGGDYAGKDSVKFESINSVASLVSYINLTLLPALHASEWYNGADLRETGTTADMTTRLLGVPRLRQLRTVLDSCKSSGAISSQSDCSSEISSSNMDRYNYGIGWNPFNQSTFKESRMTLPWMYQDMWQTKSLVYFGEYATYHGGGYVSVLGRNLKNSQVVLKFLQNFNWLDHHTRAVFIEFTTYNINRNLFNVVHLLTEWSVSSAWTTSYNIQTVKLLVLGGEHGTMWLISSLLFLLMLCLLMLRQFLILRKVSSREFFKSWWNIIDIVIIALGFSAILFYFFRSIYVSSLIKMLEAADGNEFVSFFFAVQYDFLLTVLIAILVCLSTGRLWKLLRFGESFRTVEMTITQAVSSMVTLTLCMGLFLLAFSGVVHLLMGRVIKEYRKFFYTFTALFYFSVGIGEHFEFEELYKVNSLMGPILFFLFCAVVSIYLTNIFMSVLMAYYSASQIHVQLMREDYNLLDYLRDEWAYLMSRISWRSTQCRRLRGGEDVQEYLPLVVPKPIELWSMNTMEITTGRLKTMSCLALARARKHLSMAALVEDIVTTNEGRESEGTKRFHVGVDYEGEQMIPEDTLEAMENAVNRLSRIRRVRKEDQKVQEDSAIHLLNERLENVLENIVSLERQTSGDWNSSPRPVVPTIEPSDLVRIDKNLYKLPKHVNEMRAYSTENISEIIHEPGPEYVTEEISQRTYKKQIFGAIYSEAPKSCITLVDKKPNESELRKLNKLEKSNVEGINATSKVDSSLSCVESTRHQPSSSSTCDSYQLLRDISSDSLRRDVGVGFSTTLDQLYKDVQQWGLESTCDSYQQLHDISSDSLRTDVAGGFDTNFETVFSLCDKKPKDGEDEKKTGQSGERPAFPKFKSASLPNIPSRVDFLNKGAIMHHPLLNDEERSNGSRDSLNSTDSGVSVGLKDVFR